MIVDIFTFYNEFDLLEFRMKLLYDLVDKFVIVEGDTTFSGQPKPFNFERKQERFAWAKDKIVYHKAVLNPAGLDFSQKPKEFDPDNPFFQLEYQQRNAILQAIKDMPDDTIIMLSDVDEMPAREVVNFLKGPRAHEIMPFACTQKMFYYSLDYLVSPPINCTICAHASDLRKYTPQGLRHLRNKLGRVNDGGWHLSYFGDPNFIANKIGSFAHQEYNNDAIKDTARLEACIREGKDPFGRSEITLSRVPRSIFPPYFLKLAEENEKFFFSPVASHA